MCKKKTISADQCRKQEYGIPVIEVMNARVERGFAGRGEVPAPEIGGITRAAATRVVISTNQGKRTEMKKNLVPSASLAFLVGLLGITSYEKEEQRVPIIGNIKRAMNRLLFIALRYDRKATKG